MKFKDLKVGTVYNLQLPHEVVKVKCIGKKESSFYLRDDKFGDYNGLPFSYKGEYIGRMSVISKPWTVNRHAAQAMSRVDKLIDKMIDDAKRKVAGSYWKAETRMYYLSIKQENEIHFNRLCRGIPSKLNARFNQFYC